MEHLKSTEQIRIDKWLWAARFFKTRSLAAEAVDGGKVHLNGNRTKSSHIIRGGDELKIRRGPYEWVVVVQALSAHRGPASEAQLIYEETEDSKKNRETLAAQLRLQGQPGLGLRCPASKKDRRQIVGFKRHG